MASSARSLILNNPCRWRMLDETFARARCACLTGRVNTRHSARSIIRCYSLRQQSSTHDVSISTQRYLHSTTPGIQCHRAEAMLLRRAHRPTLHQASCFSNNDADLIVCVHFLFVEIIEPGVVATRRCKCVSNKMRLRGVTRNLYNRRARIFLINKGPY